MLYNDVRRTDGGLQEAARFLTERRGVSIHPEALRKKLRGLPGESVDIDLALLLSEWMQTKAGGAEYSHRWLQTVNAQEGMHCDVVPEAPAGGWKCEISALKDKCLKLTTKLGRITGLMTDAAEDQRITEEEAGPLLALIRAARVILHRMERNVLRAVGKGRGL
ncbi:hypothetical protein V8Z80_08395 [Orrella sp. JC864]|uniref:hypothetical protein n=1 Tax=Orrella sp. JC864 TaxID=3120298 RepID=UPI00300BAD3B